MSGKLRLRTNAGGSLTLEVPDDLTTDEVMVLAKGSVYSKDETYSKAEVDALLAVETIVPTLLNGWVAYGGGFDPFEARKVNGVVHIAGLIKDGTVTSGTVLFVMPVGWRPAQTKIVCAYTSGNITARVDAAGSGNVSANALVNPGWLSIDITYIAVN